MINDTVSAAFISASDALRAAAEQNELPTDRFNVMAGAINVADFAFVVAQRLAEGAALDDREAADHFRWALWKMIEVNDMLPEGVRNDLPAGAAG